MSTGPTPERRRQWREDASDPRITREEFAVENRRILALLDALDAAERERDVQEAAYAQCLVKWAREFRRADRAEDELRAAIASADPS